MHKLNGKRIVLLFCFLIISIRIVYIWEETEVKGYYHCSSEGIVSEKDIISCQNGMDIACVFQPGNQKLNSLEFIFTNIPENVSGMIRLSIETETGVFYQSAIPVSGLKADQWYRVNVNLLLDQGKEYILRLAGGEDISVPDLYLTDVGSAAPEIKESYVNGIRQSGQFLCRYGYFQPVSGTDKWIATVFWLLLFGAAVCFCRSKTGAARVAERLPLAVPTGEKRTGLCILIELLLCCVVLDLSGIAVQPEVKFVCCIVSLLAFIHIREKREYFLTACKGTAAKAGFVLLVFLAAFMLVGNRAFLYPLDGKTSIGDVLIFLLAALWLAPLLLALLYFLDRISSGISAHTNGSKIRFCIFTVLLLLLPTGLALYGLNPGTATGDTAECLGKLAHDIWHMTNWHPPFYILILKCIIKIWDSTYAVILVQWFFWVYVFLELFLFLRERGSDERVLLFAAFLTGCTVSNLLYISTIWKDIPYVTALLWLTVLIIKFVSEPERCRHRRYIYLELVTALVFAALLRQNGIVPYFFILTGLGVLFYRNRRLIFSLLVSLLLIMCVKGPVYSYFGVQEVNTGGKYIGLGQDILGVYYAGGDVSEDTMKMICTLTRNNVSNFRFDPYRASTSYDLDVHVGEFIKNYLDTFFRNPVIMSKEILLRQDYIWDIFDGESGNFGFLYTQEDMTKSEKWRDLWFTYYPKHVDNAFTKMTTDITAYSRSNQLLYLTGWRTGLWFLLAAVLFYEMCVRNFDKKFFLIYVPMAGHILGLVLSTGWNDFRYYWPINLMTLYIFLAVPVLRRERSDSDKA